MAAKWTVHHNDFWHRNESNYGRFFVATTKFAAAYDSPIGEIAVWMPKSPWLTDTPDGLAKHLEHNRIQESRAQIIADALNSYDRR